MHDAEKVVEEAVSKVCFTFVDAKLTHLHPGSFWAQLTYGGCNLTSRCQSSFQSYLYMHVNMKVFEVFCLGRKCPYVSISFFSTFISHMVYIYRSEAARCGWNIYAFGYVLIISRSQLLILSYLLDASIKSLYFMIQYNVKFISLTQNMCLMVPRLRDVIQVDNNDAGKLNLLRCDMYTIFPSSTSI